MASIEADLYHRLQKTLLKCSEFESDSQLKAIFVDSRISLWRNNLPQAANALARVKATIDWLSEQTRQDTGQNGLVLLLHVLSDPKDPNDKLRNDLVELADELKTYWAKPTLIQTPMLSSSSTPLSKLFAYIGGAMGCLGIIGVAIIVIIGLIIYFLYPRPDTVTNRSNPLQTDLVTSTHTAAPTNTMTSTNTTVPIDTVTVTNTLAIATITMPTNTVILTNTVAPTQTAIPATPMPTTTATPIAVSVPTPNKVITTTPMAISGLDADKTYLEALDNYHAAQTALYNSDENATLQARKATVIAAKATYKANDAKATLDAADATFEASDAYTVYSLAKSVVETKVAEATRQVTETTLTNGDFERGFANWSITVGSFNKHGSGLQFGIGVNNNLLLGSPDHVSGEVPVGYVSASRKFIIEKTYLKIDYRIVTKDVLFGIGNKQEYFDTFEVVINKSPVQINDNDRDYVGCRTTRLNPNNILQIFSDGLIFCGGHLKTSGLMEGALYDLGWKSTCLDVRNFSNKEITLHLTLWQREYDEKYYNDHGLYNTFVYVDNVLLVDTCQ